MPPSRDWHRESEEDVLIYQVISRFYDEFIQSLDTRTKELKWKLGYILAFVAIEGLESVLQLWFKYGVV